MVRYKTAVRKFAHNASITSRAEKRPEPADEEITQPPAGPLPASPPPVPISSLLNRAAFNNVHTHVDDQQLLHPSKVALVVLDRIEPTESGRSGSNKAEENRRENNDRDQPSTSTRHSNDNIPRRKRRTRVTKMVTRRDSGSIADSVYIRDMKMIKLRNRDILRPWDYAEKVKAQKRAQRMIQKSLQTVLTPRYDTDDDNRTSESGEDNRPLTYLLKTTNQKKRKMESLPVPRKVTVPSSTSTSGRNAIDIKKKTTPLKKPVKKTEPAKKGNKSNAQRQQIISLSNDDSVNGSPKRLPQRQRRDSNASSTCERSFFGFSTHNKNDENNVPNSSSSSCCLISDLNDIEEELIPLTANAESLHEEPPTSKMGRPSETPTQASQRSSVPRESSSSLSNLVIGLYNWQDKSRLELDNESRGNLHSAVLELTDEDDNPVNNGNIIISYVNQWLTDSNNCTKSTHSQKNDSLSLENHAQFKVPGTPPWRLTPSDLSESPVRNVCRTPLAPRELTLRKHCTAWNYDKLCNIEYQREFIRNFCAECTRCKVMFRAARPLYTNTTWRDRSGSDVYEFIAEGDKTDTSPIAPYRGVRTDEHVSTSKNNENRMNIEKCSIFVTISNHPEYHTIFKDYLSTNGKKIYEASLIIRNKLNEGLGFSREEQNILGQVIGLLIDSNSGPRTDNERRASSNNSDGVIECNSDQILSSPVGSQMESSRIDSGSSSCSKVQDEIPSKRVRSTNHEAASPLPDAGQGLLQESHKFSASEEDFAQSPVKFTSRILQKYPRLGLCGITPPPSFKPVCDINDTHSSFKVTNLYIHRMLQRWGPLTRELSIIRSLQDPKTHQSPLFAGLELDLVKLYHTVQDENGIEAVNSDMENWETVKQKMGLYYGNKIKTKLQNIYFKYLLGYSALSVDERCIKNVEIDACWNARQQLVMKRSHNPLYRQARMRRGSPCDVERQSRMDHACAEAEDCVTNGRSCDLKTFYKLAQQVQNTYFPDNPNPSPEQVELEFWDIVLSASSHVCVHAASVDTAEHGYGFPADRNSHYGDHPWNLKRLGVSSWNLLSYLGPTPGVSSTSLQYGMTFSASCWHMDPTKVPYIEYLHEGPPKIWYSISGEQSDLFRYAAESQCPFTVLNKSIWLPCDMIFIPPPILRQYGVQVTRHVQKAGTYVVVYPNTYCACISTGYAVSEGAYFAPHHWINNVESIYLTLRNNCEPSLFAMEKLLIAMAENDSTAFCLLQRIHPVLLAQLRGELSYRQRLARWNVELLTPQAFQDQNRRTSWAAWQIQDTGECAYCRCHIVLSRVIGVTQGHTSVCAMHGIHLYEQLLVRNKRKPNIYCILLLSNDRINQIIDNIRKRIRNSAAAGLIPESRAIETFTPDSPRARLHARFL